MKIDLSGKTALITGGGQGVGAGIAVALAECGADIILTGRTLSKCEAMAEEIKQSGVRCAALGCDVKQADELENVVEQGVAKFGKLDILVNNAQQVSLGPLNKISDEDFQTNWESGPLACFRLMKLAYPHLQKNKGCVVNILSSAMKRWDVGGYGVYAAVKAAMQQLTRAAANEWGKDGIRVNAIMPHAKSPALAGWIERNPEEAQAFQATIPLGYIGECKEDIGAFVALLCSDQARYVTGQTIGVDGGQALIG